MTLKMAMSAPGGNIANLQNPGAPGGVLAPSSRPPPLPPTEGQEFEGDLNMRVREVGGKALKRYKKKGGKRKKALAIKKKGGKKRSGRRCLVQKASSNGSKLVKNPLMKRINGEVYGLSYKYTKISKLRWNPKTKRFVSKKLSMSAKANIERTLGKHIGKPGVTPPMVKKNRVAGSKRPLAIKGSKRPLAVKGSKRPLALTMA